MSFQDLGYPGYRDDFNAALNIAEVGTWANDVSMRVLSNQEIETYRFLGQPPPMRQWIGERQEIPINDYRHTIRNLPFETTLRLYDDDLRRDKKGMLQAKIRDFGTRPATHWETLLTALIVANGLCYDGQNFFDTDHSSGSSGTLKNALTSSEITALNVSTAAAPTAAEMVDILLGAAAYFYSYKDDAGEPINQNAKKFGVMVPINMLAALKSALSAQYLSNGVTNTLLAQNDWSFMPIPNPRLTTTTVMYLFRLDGHMPAFVAQEEVGLTHLFQGKDSKEYFDHRCMLWGVHSLRNVGYGLWQNAQKLTLS